jgi:hypothetical protein
MEWYDQINDVFVKNVAVGYVQELDFTPFNIFPKVRTVKSSGLIASYAKEDWLRIGNIDDYKRVGATESIGDDYEVGSQPYNVEDISFHKDVTKKEAEEYDNPYDPVNDAIKFVINRIRLVTVGNFVNTFLNTGIWGTDYTGVASGATGNQFIKWSASGSTPISDILNYQDAIRSFTGFKPNRMVMTPDVYNALKTNAEIKDSLKVTSDKVVTKDILARLFEVDTLEILSAVRTTAKKGEASTKTNTGYFAASRVFLGYTPNKPSKFEPSAGYHMLHTHGKEDVFMDRIEMKEKNHALRLEGTMSLAPKVVAPDLGCLLSAVV